VQGSVELARHGLVRSHRRSRRDRRDLAQNGLEEREEVARMSSMLIVNRAAYKLRQDRVRELVDMLRKAVASKAP
jgi:hypothetical protein